MNGVTGSTTIHNHIQKDLLERAWKLVWVNSIDGYMLISIPFQTFIHILKLLSAHIQ